jgi:hypothetical protein
MSQTGASTPTRSSPPAADGAVAGTLTFITPQDTKPHFLSAALTGGEAEIHFEVEEHAVPIADMRKIADNLSIDREGFELLADKTTVDDLYDDAAIETVYTKEIEAMLTRRFGASKVTIFDVTRRADSGAGARNPDGLRGPASRVHVDYTVKSGPQRAKDALGEEEVDRLLAKGARIIQVNVWRPITGPVRRSPLALADASSVQPENLVATDQIFPNRVGEIYNVSYDPAQRWYFAPEITRDEVILIKGWDSVDDGRASFTPHGAFVLPDTPADAPARESIEVRTFVVIE